MHPEAPGNLLIDGRLRTEGFDAALACAAPGRRDRDPLAPPERHAARGARRACELRARDRPHHARRLGADAAHAAHRHRRPFGHARERPSRRGARCRRRFWPKDVAVPRVSRGGLDRAPVPHLGRLDRGSPREPDRLGARPRPAPPGARRLRCRRPPAGARRRHPLQCRRLLLLPRDLRRRAA